MFESEASHASEESARRADRRRELAVELAERMFGDVDVEVSGQGDWDAQVEFVDGGYWIAARVFVSCDTVDGAEGAPS